MAKKRYVGFKYESPDDKEPVFDAKGIETVRRDGVLAQRKLVENCLKWVSLPVFMLCVTEVIQNTIPYPGSKSCQGLLLSLLVQDIGGSGTRPGFRICKGG